jgi:hypothetical protein
MYSRLIYKLRSIHFVLAIIVIHFIIRYPINFKYVFEGDDIFSVNPILRQEWLNPSNDAIIELFKYRLFLQRILSYVFEFVSPNSTWPFFLAWALLTLSAVVFYIILRKFYSEKISFLSVIIFLIYPRDETLYKLSGLGYTILVLTLLLIILINIDIKNTRYFHLRIAVSVFLIILGYILYENGLIIAITVFIIMILAKIGIIKLKLNFKTYYAFSVYFLIYLVMFMLQTLVSKPHYLRNPNIRFDSINFLTKHFIEIFTNGNKFYLITGITKRIKLFEYNLNNSYINNVVISLTIMALLSVIVTLLINKKSINKEEMRKYIDNKAIFISAALLILISPISSFTLVNPGEKEFPWRLSILIPIGLATIFASGCHSLIRTKLLIERKLLIKPLVGIIFGYLLLISHGEHIGFYTSQNVNWKIIEELNVSQIQFYDKIEINIEKQFLEKDNKFLIDENRILHHVHVYGSSLLDKINYDVDVYNQIITCVNVDIKPICITNLDEIQPKYKMYFSSIVSKL